MEMINGEAPKTESCVECLVEKCASCIRQGCILSEKACNLCSEDKHDTPEFEDIIDEIEECQKEKLNDPQATMSYEEDIYADSHFDEDGDPYMY
ncbi:hypothetical protein [Methanonatronarchaeum sp. AMET6-2]|uniref:hypothetical protein n=1 Tax=Methanonatronarchaeum sp. AMET6-2 TaxID=2933293 RepID=UPI00121B658C|nr:hypothetical protein [Methanonatronarchaeum sp. AMET6-2]RZN60402.1 MAG: hypothetical protein EF811_06595 [Methanonatronarchaeia archaeon]UOY10384.1 hypothetical protein MU439_01775 [Methanonatronarchaeum sp. AMET6-2]